MSNKLAKTGAAGGLITIGYVALGALGIVALLAIPIYICYKIIKWIVD